MWLDQSSSCGSASERLLSVTSTPERSKKTSNTHAFQFLKTKFKPDAGELAGGFIDKGRAHFRFVRDEELDEIPCHRFEVSGPAFRNLKGRLWINAKDGLIERFEHSLPDNPDWTSFRLVRIGSRPRFGPDRGLVVVCRRPTCQEESLRRLDALTDRGIDAPVPAQ